MNYTPSHSLGWPHPKDTLWLIKKMAAGRWLTTSPNTPPPIHPHSPFILKKRENLHLTYSMQTTLHEPCSFASPRSKVIKGTSCPCCLNKDMFYKNTNTSTQVVATHTRISFRPNSEHDCLLYFCQL